MTEQDPARTAGPKHYCREMAVEKVLHIAGDMAGMHDDYALFSSSSFSGSDESSP